MPLSDFDREVAAAAIFKEANRHLDVTLLTLGITDAKELLKTLDKKDRYRIKSDLVKSARKAPTLRVYLDGLSPVQQAYLVMHGRDSEVAFDIAEDNAERWKQEAYKQVDWKSPAKKPEPREPQV